MTYAYLYSVQTKKQVWRKNEYKVNIKLESQKLSVRLCWTTDIDIDVVGMV